MTEQQQQQQQQVPLEEAPEHFLCPLTLGILIDPLMHKITKHSFEASEILRWMYTNANPTCPLTRRPIHPSDFVENKALKMEIEKWRLEHNLLAPSSAISQDEDEDNEEEDTEKEDIMFHTQMAGREATLERENSLKHLMNIRNRVLERHNSRIAAILNQSKP